MYHLHAHLCELTIQKRQELANCVYLSIVDKTLNIRQMRTIMNLYKSKNTMVRRQTCMALCRHLATLLCMYVCMYVCVYVYMGIPEKLMVHS